MLEELIIGVEAVSRGLKDGSLVQSAFRDWWDIEDIMRRMQQDQLMGGLRSDGQQITPSMTRDPFFKGNMKRALRYADRKAMTAYDPRRGYDTPNLFINGYFHSGFYPVFRQDEVYMDNLNKVIPVKGRPGDDLYKKYGEDTFGLTEENWEALLPALRMRLIDTIETKLQR